MKIAYTCKFCRRPGMTQCECTEEQMRAMGFAINFWKSILACNRCADFAAGKRRLVDSVRALCWNLLVARKGREKNIEKIEESAKRRLTEITKRYCAQCADYHRHANIWDEEMVAALMDKPDRVYEILRRTEDLFRQPKQPELTPRPEPAMM